MSAAWGADSRSPQGFLVAKRQQAYRTPRFAQRESSEPPRDVSSGHTHRNLSFLTRSSLSSPSLQTSQPNPTQNLCRPLTGAQPVPLTNQHALAPECTSVSLPRRKNRAGHQLQEAAVALWALQSKDIEDDQKHEQPYLELPLCPALYRMA